MPVDVVGWSMSRMMAGTDHGPEPSMIMVPSLPFAIRAHIDRHDHIDWHDYLIVAQPRLVELAEWNSCRRARVEAV
jgi:hypothetical protein